MEQKKSRAENCFFRGLKKHASHIADNQTFANFFLFRREQKAAGINEVICEVIKRMPTKLLTIRFLTKSFCSNWNRKKREKWGVGTRGGKHCCQQQAADLTVTAVRPRPDGPAYTCRILL